MQWRPKSKSFKDKVEEKVAPKQKVKLTKNTGKLWTLRFDVSKCKKGAGVGIELISPKNKSYYAAYHL